MTDNRTVWLVVASLLVVVLAALGATTYLVAATGADIANLSPLTSVVALGAGALAGILANTRGTGPAQ